LVPAYKIDERHQLIGDNLARPEKNVLAVITSVCLNRGRWPDVLQVDRYDNVLLCDISSLISGNDRNRKPGNQYCCGYYEEGAEYD